MVQFCAIDGCSRGTDRLRKGLCQTHYYRLRRFGTTDLPQKTTICSINGCEKSITARGWCRTHYERWRATGTTELLGHKSGKEHHRYKGGKSKTPYGYVRMTVPADHFLYPLTVPDHKMPEHRFVMADHLGRPLTRQENVHHKNGNKSDNRLSNLELWSKAQPAGQRVSDKIAWAKEFLREYGETLD